MENITWERLDEYPGYEISNTGLIKRNSRDKVRNTKPIVREGHITDMGYVKVYMRDKNGKRKPEHVHRLVGMAFIPNPENKPFINHINAIRNDNRVENLEWCTHQENMAHARKMGLFAKQTESRSKKVIDVSNGKKYTSLRDAARQIGISSSYLGFMLNGKTKNITSMKFAK